MPSLTHPGPIALLRELVSLPSVSSTSPTWDQGNRAVIDLLAENLALTQWLSVGTRVQVVVEGELIEITNLEKNEP